MAEEPRPVEIGQGGWLKTRGNEPLLAGYVGFNKVEDLRRFIISWPIVSLWDIFDEDARIMPKKVVFRVADKEWAKLSTITSATSPEFDIQDDASPEVKKLQKQRRLAWVCLHLAHVIQTMYNKWSDAANIEETTRVQNEFSKSHEVIFPDADVQTVVPKITIDYRSDLGENKLEVISRCWELFRYFSWLMHTQYAWSRVQSVEAMKKTASVRDKNLPPWMRARKEVVKSTRGSN